VRKYHRHHHTNCRERQTALTMAVMLIGFISSTGLSSGLSFPSYEYLAKKHGVTGIGEVANHILQIAIFCCGENGQNYVLLTITVTVLTTVSDQHRQWSCISLPEQWGRRFHLLCHRCLLCS